MHQDHHERWYRGRSEGTPGPLFLGLPRPGYSQGASFRDQVSTGARTRRNFGVPTVKEDSWSNCPPPSSRSLPSSGSVGPEVTVADHVRKQTNANNLTQKVYIDCLWPCTFIKEFDNYFKNKDCVCTRPRQTLFWRDSPKYSRILVNRSQRVSSGHSTRLPFFSKVPIYLNS